MTDEAAPIRTDRLILLPCDAALLGAVMRDEPLPGVVRGPEWPGDDLRGAIPLMLARMTSLPEGPGWGPWLIVAGDEIIGDAGAHGPPDDRGDVEIGFSIIPSKRGSGIAAEAVTALLAWMRGAPAFRRAVARTRKDNVAAQAVLRRCGFRPGAGEGDLVVWTT